MSGFDMLQTYKRTVERKNIMMGGKQLSTDKAEEKSATGEN